MSKEKANGQRGLGNMDTAPIPSTHPKSQTKTRSNEEQIKLPENRNNCNSDLTQVTTKASTKNISNMKEKQAQDSEVVEVKVEPISTPDGVIDVADDSNSDDKSNDSSDGTERNIPVEVKEMLTKGKIDEEMFRDIERLYKTLRSHFKSKGNKPNERETKREPVASCSSPKKPRSASESVQFSTVNEIFSSCNNEASSMKGNVENARDSTSFKRYEDTNNGDLDYIEETMNFEIEGLIKYEPELIIDDDDDFFYNPSNDFSNVPSSDAIQHDSIQVDRKIAYFGLDDVALSDNVTFDTTSIDFVPAAVKNEPLKEEPKDNAELDVIILSDDEEPNADVSCKKEIKDEEIVNDCGETLDGCNDLSRNMVLSDSFDDDLGYYQLLQDRKFSQLEGIGKSPSRAEETEVVEDFDEDSRETLVNENPEEQCLLSDDSSDAGHDANSHQKRGIKRAGIESDEEMETNYEEAVCDDIRGNESNEGNATTNESSKKLESTDNKYRRNETSRDESKSSGKKRSLTGDLKKMGDDETEDDEKTSYDEKESYEKKITLSDKNSHDETKSYDKKISSDGTKVCNKNTSGGKKRSVDEILAHYKKKPKYEKSSGDEKKYESEEKCKEGRELKEEKKYHEERSSKDKKRFKEKKRCYEERKFKDERPYKEKKYYEKCRPKDQKGFPRVKGELPDGDIESEDESALKKIEHKARSYKHVKKQRLSSEVKSTRLSESSNDNFNENSSGVKSAINPRPMPMEFPTVALIKLKEPIKRSPHDEKASLAINGRSVTKIKTTSKQEAPAESVGEVQPLQSNEGEHFSTKESKKLTSCKSKTNLSGVFTSIVSIGPKHLLEEEKPIEKDAEDVPSHVKKTAPLEGEALSEAAKKIIEKKKNMTLDSGSRILIEKREYPVANNFADYKRTSVTKRGYEEYRDAGDECCEGRKRRDKSVDLMKEADVNQNASPVHRDRTSRERTEERSRSRRSSTDSNVSSANRNSFSKVNEESRKSLDLAKEILPKDGWNTEGVGHSVEKTLLPKWNISQYTEKPVRSFVGKIPKKSVSQPNGPEMSMTSDYHGNNFGSLSNTRARVSSIDEQVQKEKIWARVTEMVVKDRKKKKATSTSWATNKDANKSVCPKLEQFLLHIFEWDPAWLTERNQLNANRKVIDEDSLVPMQPKYKMYEDYYRDAERLLVQDAWQAMRSEREVKEMRAKPSTNFSIVSRSAMCEKVPGTNIELMSLLLDVVVSKRELLTQAHPVVGDLVYFEYFLMGQKTECSNRPKLLFAYVSSIRTNIITSDLRFKRDLLDLTEEPHSLLTYTVITRPMQNHSDMQTNRICQMTTIPYFRPNTRNIRALQCLPNSPLMNKIIHPKVEDYKLPPAKNLENYPLITQDNLDAKQLDAVARISEALVKGEPKICLVQGPPGSGKTKFITNLITQIIYGDGRFDRQLVKDAVLPLNQGLKKKFKILVCAPSNVATDEIVKRLLEHRKMFEKKQRFKMVRFGRIDMMDDNIKDVSITTLAEKEVTRLIQNSRCSVDEKKKYYNDQITKLETARQREKNPEAKKHIARKIEDNRTMYNLFANPRTADQFDGKARAALYRAAENAILEGAHVVVCTLGSCCTTSMEAAFLHGESNVTSVCIIDEADKISEASTLLPLLLGIKTLVLVGDNLQLPTPVPPDKTKQRALSQSLFARMQQVFAGQAVDPTIRFDTQYRMSYPVACWPRRQFYGGEIYSVANLSPLPLHNYKVMDLDSTPDDEADGKSGMTNTCEGYFVAAIIYTLVTHAKLDRLRAPIQVGVITPNKDQKLLIEDKISYRLLKVPRQKMEKISYDVGTINGFQGQERDVIILSCVGRGSMRVWSDPQKMCLALTRAKHSLIICGNFQAFRSDRMWNDLLVDAEVRGAYVNVRWDYTTDEIKSHLLRSLQY